MLPKLRPNPIFYLLLVYVLLQFCWWAYMLVDLNREVILLNNIITPTPNDVSKKINSKTWMVIGEGIVFLILLGSGAFLTLRSFKKEVLLSNQQKNFLLSATHELKSPLASIKLLLETFQKRELTSEQKKPLLENALVETDRLNSLIENMMLASHFDNKSFSIEKSMLNISTLTKEIAERFKANYPNIIIEIEENLTILSNKHAFSSILYNLIDNAIKYGGDEVKIQLKKQNKSITLLVMDNGVGIPPNEVKNIFKRFYRIGNELTREKKGTGLGLYIVKKLADFHHASISVQRNSPKGTIFAIKF